MSDIIKLSENLECGFNNLFSYKVIVKCFLRHFYILFSSAAILYSQIFVLQYRLLFIILLFSTVLEKKYYQVTVEV